MKLPAPRGPRVKRATYYLELPPSANAIWAFRAKSKRVTKSTAYHTWLERNTRALRSQGLMQVQSPVRIYLTLLAGTTLEARRDIDNLIKPLVDLLRHTRIIREDNLNHVHAVCIHLRRTRATASVIRARIVSVSQPSQQLLPLRGLDGS